MKIEPEPEVVATGQDEPINSQEEPQILEEILIEELGIDGICGVY